MVFSSDLAAAPTVISVAPISGAADASTGTSVAATFSTAMDPATINALTFRLLDPSGNQVPATVSYSTYTDTARLTPAASLAPATTYTAVVKGGTGGVEDSAGNPMAVDYSWSFTTATPQPGPAPVVAMTWPAAGAVGVDPRGVITATFNVEMDLKTITADTVQLLDPTGASVPIGVTYGGETATVTITPLGMGLAPGATYTTVIKGGDAGVKSLAGEPMAADYAWSFTTRTACHITDLGTVSAPLGSDRCIMNPEVRRETHPHEEVTPIHPRVQGSGRPGGLDRRNVPGRGVPQAWPQPQPADHLEGHLPGAGAYPLPG